jgi:hypothetical protein
MSTISDLVQDEALVADSYARVKGDLAAVPVDELAPVNLDVQTISRLILGALPEMRTLRDRMVKELPAFDVATFDKLEDYVQALKFAQSGFQIATQPPDDLKPLVEEGGKLHDRLLADVKALSAYGLFDGTVLDSLKGGNGFNNLAEDLEMLSHAMVEGWAKIQGKALTPLEDVHTASRIGLRLTRIAGLREQGPARLAAATELRLRAYTLVVHTYQEARSAISYLRRREDDVESIAPSLFSGRTRKKPVDGGGDATHAPAGTVPAPGTTSPVVTAPTAAVGAPAVPVSAQDSSVASKGPFV